MHASEEAVAQRQALFLTAEDDPDFEDNPHPTGEERVQEALRRFYARRVVTDTLEEAQALQRIDEARDDELRARTDTPEARARRMRRMWASRGRQLGGSW